MQLEKTDTDIDLIFSLGEKSKLLITGIFIDPISAKLAIRPTAVRYECWEWWEPEGLNGVIIANW